MVTNTQKIHQYPTLPSFPVTTHITIVISHGMYFVHKSWDQLAKCQNISEKT